MKKICESIRENVMKIINFWKKKLLTNKQQELNEKGKNLLYLSRKSKDNFIKDNFFWEVRDNCNYTGKYRSAAHGTCNLKYSVPKEIRIVFQNGSNYGYHFIIKKLAEKFEGQVNCVGQNTEKSINFSVPIETEVTRIDKSWKEFQKLLS